MYRKENVYEVNLYSKECMFERIYIRKNMYRKNIEYHILRMCFI